MQKIKYWEWIGYCLFAIASAAALVLLGRSFDLSKSDWAAWVQAVGSIAAIAGAYFIGERQAIAALKNDLKIRQVELKQKKKAVLAIAVAAKEQVGKIAQACVENDVERRRLELRRYNARTTSDIVNAFAAVPVHELGSFDAVSAFFHIRDCLSRVDGMYSSNLAILEEVDEEDQQAVRYRNFIVRSAKDEFFIICEWINALEEAFNSETLST